MEQKGKSATRAKNKYRGKNYDRVEVVGPLGIKEKLEVLCKDKGYESRNSFILEAIREKAERDGVEWNI